ncbi:hypothetical protein HMPREF2830_19550 [Pseudomonas aeruginosa]|nr:hypothetical protein HMPREF2830_19550 [Pseudomonas aeruginosa]
MHCAMRDGAVMSLGLELDGPVWGRIKEQGMSFEEIKIYLIWGGVFLAMAVQMIFDHNKFGALFSIALVVATGIKLARDSYRKDYPKQ